MGGRASAYASLGAGCALAALLLFFLTHRFIFTAPMEPAASSTPEFMLTSSAFADQASMPTEYTCEGANTSPPLSWSGAPEGTKSFALIMDDPDAPRALLPAGVFDHWVLFNIPADIAEIPAGGTAGTAGANGRGANEYTGPCPPTNYEPKEHRYVFVLYALDAMLDLPAGAGKADVAAALQGHVLGEAALTGRYQKLGQ